MMAVENIKTRIAVSGQAGSFSEEAGIKYASSHGCQNPLIVYGDDMEAAFTALDNGEADLGTVPVYNKIHGPVIPAMEAMGRHHFSSVVGQVRLAIVFCLLAKAGIPKEKIREIAHFPVAAHQCRKYLGANFPGIQENPRADSALAAKELSEGILSPDTAVIAPKRCVEIYAGLQILDEGIQDVQDNFTDFIVVKK